MSKSKISKISLQLFISAAILTCHMGDAYSSSAVVDDGQPGAPTASSSSSSSITSAAGGIHEDFVAAKPIIEQCLNAVNHAELHFFWTTGYQVGDLDTKFGANGRVMIGGSQCSENFQQYLDFLLANSPDKLTIKLVADRMTVSSNTWLSELCAKHNGRLQILPIEGVVINLASAFGEKWGFLEIIFQNAIRGNPAIASDLYRLVGMLYGSNPNPDQSLVMNTQYTYCDVDTFCFGMKCKQRFEQKMALKKLLGIEGTYTLKRVGENNDDGFGFIRALFSKMEPLAKIKGLSFGKRQNGSSLIKFNIQELSVYEAFCVGVLYAVKSASQSAAKSAMSESGQFSRLNLLNYFLNLHDYAVKGATDSENSFSGYLKEFSPFSIRVQNIVEVTGPGLLKYPGRGECHELTYDDNNAMEWHRTHYLENPHYSQPLADLGGGNDELDKAFTTYGRQLSDAYYLRRLGAEHPFVKRFTQHLQANFPYASPAFKDYMRQLHDNEKTLDGYESKEKWLAAKFALITKKSEKLDGLRDIELVELPYYARLTSVLQQLGINRPLTVADLD